MSPHVFAGFAERLEAARLAKGMTKAHVCDALGLPNQRYVTLMRGGGIKHLPRLAALLGVRVEWLTTGAYPPEWYRPEVMRFAPAREHAPAEEQESGETTAPVPPAPCPVRCCPT